MLIGHGLGRDCGLNRRRMEDFWIAIDNDQGALIFRYDNAPHHHVSTFPDHKHTPDEVMAASARELLCVIDEIEKLI